jgi:diamine N-acetyltransferase
MARVAEAAGCYRVHSIALVPDQPDIRIATPADAVRLAALAERTFRDSFSDENSAADMDAYVQGSFSLDRIRDELADDANTFLLAFVDDADEPAGYAKLRAGPTDPSVTGPDPVELERLYVERNAIGQGVGAALMQAVLGAARLADRRTLWLGVWEHNPRAISFYERWGFEVVGDHVFRLGSDDQRDLVMERPVPGAG